MKNILLILLALVALVGGFYWLNNYIYTEKQADVVVQDEEMQNTEELEKFVTYEDKNLGFKFDYRESPNGYKIGKIIGKNSDPNYLFISSVELMLKSDDETFTEMKNRGVSGEAPPKIYVSVYRNIDKLWPAVWADKNPMYSNINTKLGDMIETSVGGAKAVTYSADGLYVMQNFVVTNGDYVFVLTGEQIAEHDHVALDFGPLVESFKFIPSVQ